MRATLFSMLLLGGCVTSPAVGGAYHLAKNTATECATHCRTIGMELSAVVIIANSTGCVCTVPGAAAPPGGPAAAAGSAAMEMQAAAERQATPVYVPPAAH